MKTKLSLILGVAALATLQPALLTAQNISPAAGSTTLPSQPQPDGFIMVGGKTYVVNRGVATPLNEEMTLRVTPNAVIGFDDLPRTIRNNAMLTLDGRMVAAPTGLAFAPAPAPTLDTRLLDRGVYGNNLSGLAPSRAAPSRVGPRNIIAKKSTTVKSRNIATARKGSTSLTAKKPVVTAKAKAPVTFPAFADEVLTLPDQPVVETPNAGPVIDATSTMLYMTKVPDSPAPSETSSISASLGIITDPTETLKGPNAFAPVPPLPAPNLVVPPTVSAPEVNSLKVDNRD